MSLNQQAINSIIKDVRKLLKTSTNLDKITLNYEIPKDNFKTEYPNIKVILSNEAWIKMQLLVAGTDKEIACHGVSYKLKPDEYFIGDILIYPQTVTGTTVEADDDLYAEWIMELTDDQINNMRFQMHSHVNMSVSPSGTDQQHRNDMLTQVEDYYIFMIMNKKQDIHIEVFDIEQQIIYETEDIEFLVDHANQDTYSQFFTDLSEKVQSRSYNHYTTQAKPRNKKGRKYAESYLQPDAWDYFKELQNERWNK